MLLNATNASQEEPRVIPCRYTSCIFSAFPEHDLLATDEGIECKTGGIAGQDEEKLLSYIFCWLLWNYHRC